MGNIIVKALSFVLVIVIAYGLKKKGVLKKEDGDTLAKIIMNVTLPCALLSSAMGIKLDLAMIIVLLIGLLSNIVMIALTYLFTLKETPMDKGAYIINCSGYNIGNFVMPFAQSFFPGLGVAYLCMFDIGNSIMCLGGSYAIASSITSAKEKLSFQSFMKKLLSSLPFDVYIVIFILSLFQLSLPEPLYVVASFIGSGNGFLAMFMIGLLLEINLDKKETAMVTRILMIRLIFSFIFMGIVYYLLPLPYLAKIMVVLAFGAPLTTVSAVFTRQIGYERSAAAIANSLSIIIGIIVLTCLIIVIA